MSEVAFDFGTSNTVLARYNEALQRVETVGIPGISTRMSYRLTQGGEEHSVWVIPSMIHYAENGDILVGDQVVSRGLADHSLTFRWMKRHIAAGLTKKKKTAQGFRSYPQAGEDFLITILRYASDRIAVDSDTFTFTAPVETFENFQSWLFDAAEKAGVRRFKIQDEPTACAFGYQGRVSPDDRFMIFDFGGGTLDVSCVRFDLLSAGDKKAIQLGQAGCDLGGMNIDLWLADDFVRRHRLEETEKRELEALILRHAEEVKILLSDPAETEADLRVAGDIGRRARVLQTSYTRSCRSCTELGQAGRHEDPSEGCLGCILRERGFLPQVKETVGRALDNAFLKGMRRTDLSRVLITGGTSLIPVVRRYLGDEFGEKVVWGHPFDSVARGACRGIVVPLLQHDYAIECYNVADKRWDFHPLFQRGTEYPIPPEKAVRKWVNGALNGQLKIGLKIFEVSQVKRRALEVSIVGEQGQLRDESLVTTENAYICLNPDNPTFIPVNPPFDKERDRRRFKAVFTIDGTRTLQVTVEDTLTGRPVMRDQAVVRL